MIELPIITQSNDYGCGECCCRSILLYYGINKKYYLSSPVDGGNVRSMEAVFRKHNLQVISGNFGYQLLQYFIKFNIPVIVAYDSHYSIVIGKQDRKLILMNPLYDNYETISIYKFKKLWEDWSTDMVHYRNWGIAVKGNYS